MQRVGPTNGKDSGGLKAIGRERIVVAVDDNDKVLAQERLHCSSLDGVYANGNESLPKVSAGEGVGARRVDDGVGYFDRVDDLRRLNAGG